MSLFSSEWVREFASYSARDNRVIAAHGTDTPQHQIATASAGFPHIR
jgi:hypothetical protein